MHALREADKLGVLGPAVGGDAVGGEALLHVGAAGVVERQAALLHDGEDLALGIVVEARAGVAAVDVGAQVEGAARQAGLHVAGE